MKISIIGSEGSGKTVMMAMLSKYIADKKDLGFVMEPEDSATRKFIDKTIGKLAKAVWPAGTPQQEIKRLCWKISPSRPNYLSMFDCAGQDLRNLLEDNKTDHNSAVLSQLVIEMNDSDMMVFLLDLEKFFKTKDGDTIGDEAWMLRQFLDRPSWQRKVKLVAVSKCDLYPDLGENQNSICKKIKSKIRPNWSIRHLLVPRKKLRFIKISSLHIKTSEGKRVPFLPLRCGRIDPLVEEIQRQLKWHRSIPRSTGKFLKRSFSNLKKLIRRDR